MYHIVEQKPNSAVLQDDETTEIIEVPNEELSNYIKEID